MELDCNIIHVRWPEDSRGLGRITDQGGMAGEGGGGQGEGGQEEAGAEDGRQEQDLHVKFCSVTQEMADVVNQQNEIFSVNPICNCIASKM